MPSTEVSRRTFLEKALLATGALSAAVVGGTAMSAMTGDHRTSATSNGAAADQGAAGGANASAASTAMDCTYTGTESLTVPAKAVDTPEISRHPTAMPRNANYTFYENGEYRNEVERTGPITQEVHFHLKEVAAEVVSGTTMDYWTFDGQVPGPMIRARVGDTIDFFLHNPPESTMPHSVDFHAITGPGGGAARLSTAAGDTSEFRGRLLNPGIFIYHCAFPDIPMHISHGMYGLIVVEPVGGLPAVDHEFYLMQSEFYTDKGGKLQYVQLQDAGHLAFASEFGEIEQPTFVTFNGRPEAVTGDRALGMYGDARINVGDTVRLFVGNIGPNLISSFHVIGEIFDRVYVEGSFDLVNKNVQTTLVPSGGAVGVEFKAEYPGDYTAVDHAIFRIHKGAVAAIHVEGEADPAIYQSIKYSTQLGSGGH